MPCLVGVGGASCVCPTEGEVYNDGACGPCPAGRFYRGGKCLPCPAGTFASGGVGCEVCPYAWTSNASATECQRICRDGSFYDGRGCVACATTCAAGTVRVTACGLTADLVCGACGNSSLYPSVQQDACVATCPPVSSLFGARCSSHKCLWRALQLS